MTTPTPTNQASGPSWDSPESFPSLHSRVIGRWLLIAAAMGIVGTCLQLLALYVGPVAGDYRSAFWLEVVGSLLGSWAWRMWKAAK